MYSVKGLNNLVRGNILITRRNSLLCTVKTFLTNVVQSKVGCLLVFMFLFCFWHYFNYFQSFFKYSNHPYSKMDYRDILPINLCLMKSGINIAVAVCKITPPLILFFPKKKYIVSPFTVSQIRVTNFLN